MLKFTPLMMLALLLSVTSARAASHFAVSEEESMKTLSEQLAKAIESRNFQDARVAIDQLLPLMKKDLKEEKKRLTELQKSEAPETDPSVFEQQLNRKSELFESLKTLAEVSPAALRVKSTLIQDEVVEYLQLSNLE